MWRLTIKDGTAGFNEAGAIMPRSGREAGGSLHDLLASFNEAGAIMPRSGPGGRPVDSERPVLQ